MKAARLKQYFAPASILLFFICFFACGPKPLEPADVIIGLGYGPARAKNGEPSVELMRRVKKAVELYKQGLAPNIIFTGADTGAGCEADMMKEIAVKMGVPAGKIFTETKATDTKSNARYSVEIMKRQGWSKAILVSSAHHLRRAKRSFKSYKGMEFQTSASKAHTKKMGRE